MKKLLYLLVTIFASAIFLVACSSKQSIDGVYYRLEVSSENEDKVEYDGIDPETKLEIDGSEGTYWYGSKAMKIHVDQENQTITSKYKSFSYQSIPKDKMLVLENGQKTVYLVKENSPLYNQYKDK